MFLGSNIFLENKFLIILPCFHFRQLSDREKALDLGLGNRLRVSFLLIVIWIDVFPLGLNFLTCEMVLILPTLSPFMLAVRTEGY